MADQIKPEHLEQSHPKVADAIINFIQPLLPAVINTILGDPARKRKARTVLKTVRDALDGANLDS